jgi:hypothetical protein
MKIQIRLTKEEVLKNIISEFKPKFPGMVITGSLDYNGVDLDIVDASIPDTVETSAQ